MNYSLLPFRAPPLPFFAFIFSISGGTIFNAGVHGVDDPDNQGNGITVNRGSFTLSGVEVRNNVGKGIWVPSGSVSAFAITGNKIWSNGVGIDLGNAGALGRDGLPPFGTRRPGPPIRATRAVTPLSAVEWT